LPKDDRYPSGHTREVFFWALMAAMVMLVVGSGLSFWIGYRQLLEREPLRHPFLALSILVVSLMTNGYAVRQSYRRLRAGGRTFWEAFRDSSQPLVKTALLQDSLGTASAVVGLVSLGLYQALGAVPILDALGALAIAVLMVVFSLTLTVQVHHLIAGRPVPESLQQALREVVGSVPEVEAVNRLVATFAGGEEMVVDLDLDLREGLTTVRIEEVLDRVHDAIVLEEPRVRSLRVDLNSPLPAGARGHRSWR
jgi:divalent metal cation (Fe/Co/Zn/Cd) transporter